MRETNKARVKKDGQDIRPIMNTTEGKRSNKIDFGYLEKPRIKRNNPEN